MEPLEARGDCPTTVWPEISEAGQADRSAGMEALGKVVVKYRTPLLKHLLRRGMQPIDAEDVLQEFMSAKMVEQNLLGKALRERGKFRSYLMGALDKFAVSEFRKQHAQKRFPAGGFCPLEELPEAVATRHAEDYDYDWSQEVLNRALELMKAKCGRVGQPELWGIFEARLLRPILEGCKPVPNKILAAKYGLKGEVQVSKRLNDAREEYRQLLREVIAEYAGGPDAVEEELRQLRLGLFR